MHQKGNAEQLHAIQQIVASITFRAVIQPEEEHADEVSNQDCEAQTGSHSYGLPGGVCHKVR